MSRIEIGNFFAYDAVHSAQFYREGEISDNLIYQHLADLRKLHIEAGHQVDPVLWQGVIKHLQLTQYDPEMKELTADQIKLSQDEAKTLSSALGEALSNKLK